MHRRQLAGEFVCAPLPRRTTAVRSRTRPVRRVARFLPERVSGP